jgi:hypothetical protein
MTTSTRSVIRAFVPAGLAITIAVVTGIAWLGKPLRLVQLLTIIGLSMTAGVSWARAVWRVRQDRSTGV